MDQGKDRISRFEHRVEEIGTLRQLRDKKQKVQTEHSRVMGYYDKRPNHDHRRMISCQKHRKHF